MNLFSSCCSDSLFLMTACFGVFLIAVLGFLAVCGTRDDNGEEKKKQDD